MMRFDKFTEQAQEAARRSYEVMQRYGHTQVDVEHIFLALLEQPQGLIVEMLGRMGAPIEIMKERLDDNLQHTPRSAATPSYPQAVAQVFITPPSETRDRSGDGRSPAVEGRVRVHRASDVGHRE